VTRYVIDPGTTLALAADSVEISPRHELYAPTLWRSQTLCEVYEAVGRSELTNGEARERLRYVNALKIRLLGDAVLRRRAWELAEQLEMKTTYEAEYAALAQLQKCTLVSMDQTVLNRWGDHVPTATIDALR
jgi:predicted nucleic acid-binding protein